MVLFTLHFDSSVQFIRTISVDWWNPSRRSSEEGDTQEPVGKKEKIFLVTTLEQIFKFIEKKNLITETGTGLLHYIERKLFLILFYKILLVMVHSIIWHLVCRFSCVLVNTFVRKRKTFTLHWRLNYISLFSRNKHQGTRRSFCSL